MSRTDPQFNLRIPEALRDKVMAAAKDNKRSATAEILARLEASFDPNALIDMEVSNVDEPGFANDPTVRYEVREMKKQYQLFQEMIALLREPPTPEQIAWAEEQMANSSKPSSK